MQVFVTDRVFSEQEEDEEERQWDDHFQARRDPLHGLVLPAPGEGISPARASPYPAVNRSARGCNSPGRARQVHVDITGEQPILVPDHRRPLAAWMWRAVPAGSAAVRPRRRPGPAPAPRRRSGSRGGTARSPDIARAPRPSSSRFLAAEWRGTAAWASSMLSVPGQRLAIPGDIQEKPAPVRSAKTLRVPGTSEERLDLRPDRLDGLQVGAEIFSPTGVRCPWSAFDPGLMASSRRWTRRGSDSAVLSG